MRADDGCAFVDFHVDECGVGPDFAVVRDGGAAFELGAGMDDDVASDLDINIDPGCVGVDNGGPAAHGFFADAAVHFFAHGGELYAVVDAGDQRGVIKSVATDGAVEFAGDADDIGEVELALGVVGV